MEDKTPYIFVGEYDIKQLNHTLEDLNKISNFGVYANTVSYTNHLEAYVAAAEVAEGTVLDIVPQRSNITDGYSIVLRGGIANLKPASDSKYATVVITDETYFTGDAQKDGKPNTWIQTIIASEDDKLTKISFNLKFLGLKANTLINEENIVSIDKLYNYLAKNDFICLTISANDLVNNDKIHNIIKTMTDNNIVFINVVTNRDIDVVNINQEIYCEGFNTKCGNLYWNFGSFDGEININTHFAGTIVAPAALVRVNAGNLDGSVISNIFGNNAEVHQVRKKIVLIDEIKEEITTSAAEKSTAISGTSTKIEEENTIASTKEETKTTTAKQIETTSTIVEEKTTVVIEKETEIITTRPTEKETETVAIVIVEEETTEIETTTTSEKKTYPTIVEGEHYDIPQTGDNSDTDLFVGLLIVAISLFALVYILDGYRGK